MRSTFVFGALVVSILEVAAFFLWPPGLWSLILVGPLLLVGFVDYFQKTHAVRRNFPLIGNFRYLFEAIRPEINQYFVESNQDGVPFSREARSIVYQRAKGVLDTLPFGTQVDVYAPGYEWVDHSLAPTRVDPESLRVKIGGPDCRQPYDASLLNISAMSFGALSTHAILALNGGAHDGHFAHNTGEGGLSPYHLAPGGDLIWQIGTGYFGCRTPDGRFDASAFAEKAGSEAVRMIEIKLSQGAKPGHGGILPARKLTAEIAAIRGVPLGRDVVSPASHTAFTTPLEMMRFIDELRELSGGKPVGIKLCLGRHHELLALCKAMRESGIAPDYIAVDAGEGGTGAAPLELANYVGTPGLEGLVYVHNALVGFGLRDRIRLISSGKITTAFDMVRRMALGADLVYAARAWMLALGCIQALRCNANNCPTGVATQNPNLVAGLDVADKRKRVARFHRETIHALAEMLSAMGLEHPSQLRPRHIRRRISRFEIADYGSLYSFLDEGALLEESAPERFEDDLVDADPNSFAVSLSTRPA